jgi:hypothetical protein
MPSGWPVALAFGAGIIGLFAAAIIVGLQLRRRETAQSLLNVNADAVWNELTRISLPQDANWDRSDLLYGIWEDFSAGSVGMIVRNDLDAPLARVAYHMAGADIAAGDEKFRVRAGTSIQRSAQLVRVGQDGEGETPVCSFVGKGWLQNRVVEYSAPDIGVLRISLPVVSTFKAVTSTITRDGRNVGKLGTIGRPYFNKGRMLVLPAGLPLSIRLFVVAWGSGQR